MITGHCISCFGTGFKRTKDGIGCVRAIPCVECRGLGGTIMKR